MKRTFFYKAFYPFFSFHSVISIWKKAKHLTGNLSSSMYLHLAQEATLLTPNEKKVVYVNVCVHVCTCVCINPFAPYRTVSMRRRNFYKIYGQCIDFVLRPYFRNGVPYDVLVENVRKCCQHYNMNIILSLLDCFETQNINKMDNAVLNWGNKHLHPCEHIFSALFTFICIACPSTRAKRTLSIAHGKRLSSVGPENANTRNIYKLCTCHNHQKRL